MKVPGNYLQGGDGRKFRERFKSQCNLTPDCGIREITRQSQETPRNGAMGERSGKGSNLDEISHIARNKADCTSVPGKFPQRGDGRAFRERFKSRCNLTPYCGKWENTCQFQETSRNGAMGERSRKGSNLDAISHTAKHGRSNVSSRKLPATGQWKNVPGNVQIADLT
jgi:hypothetical protein